MATINVEPNVLLVPQFFEKFHHRGSSGGSRNELAINIVGNDAALRGTGIPAPPVSEIYAQRYCIYMALRPPELE